MNDQPIRSIPFWQNASFWFVLIIFSIAWYSGCHHDFFWDTVQLSSRQAHFFYEQKDFSLLLPEDIDSGHFPFMGLYLSLWWKVLGKTLFVSHWAMLPWIFVLTLAISELIKYYIDIPYQFLSSLILASDPTLLAQVSLVSPDIILISSFCSAIVFHVKKKSVLLTISVLLLSLISLRGLMAAFAFFISVIIWHGIRKEKTGLKKYVPVFLPAILANVAYLVYHWWVKDWVGFHQDSPWSPSFQRVSFEGFIKNTFLFAWRMVDFGRIGVVLFSLAFLLKNPGQRLRQTGWLGLLWLISGLVLFSVTTGFQSLTAHRYYLPLYVLFSLLFCTLLFHSSLGKSIKTTVALVVLTLLITGHWWYYPAGVAQGWDSSFAHRPVFGLYQETEQFLRQNSIPKKNVGTFFPFTAAEKYISLQDDTLAFGDAMSGKTPYLFLSNVMNDMPDPWLQWYTPDKALFYKKKGGIWVGIFTRE